MATRLTDYLKGRKPQGFVSKAHYFPDGDYVTFFWTDEDHVAERVDDLLTVYHSAADRSKLVGLKIKSVRHILAKLMDFNSVREGQDLSLGILFLAGLALGKNASVDPEERGRRYEDIRKVAGPAPMPTLEPEPQACP